MNANAEMLNFIYQNAEMGVSTIDQLLNIVEEGGFKSQLKAQQESYEKFKERTKNILSQQGLEEKELSNFTKMKTYLMINMQTLRDQSNAHIAEMMVIGSNMGVIDAIKNIKKYKNEVDKEIIDLMEDLKVFEEENCNTMKKYL